MSSSSKAILVEQTDFHFGVTAGLSYFICKDYSDKNHYQFSTPNWIPLPIYLSLIQMLVFIHAVEKQ